MKLLLTIACVVLCHLATYGQETSSAFDEYFELTIEARQSLDQEQHEEALRLFEEAFAHVAMPKYYDVKTAITAADYLGLRTISAMYQRLLASNFGYILGADALQDSVLHSELNPALHRLKQEYYDALDSVYVVQLADLLRRDQAIRKSGGVIYENNINSDSLRTLELLDLISKHGFPTPDRVGLRGYNSAMLIFLHADFDLDNALLGSFLYEHVFNGNVDPKDYASIIDRRCNFRGEKPYFYQVPIGYDDLSNQEKETVKQRRREIGIRDVLETMVVERLPNGDIRVNYKY